MNVLNRVAAGGVMICAFVSLFGCANPSRENSGREASPAPGLPPSPSRQETAPVPVSFPLSARLVAPAGEPLAAGRFAPHLKVAIRNTTPLAARQGVAMPLQAIVLRGVHWANDPADSRQWLRPLPGKADASADGVVAHNMSAGGVTDVAFETGLLLPGEEITLPAPTTPAPGGRNDLVVRYAVIADGKDWMGEVLLPAELPRHAGAWFRPATPTLAANRKGASDLSMADYPPAYQGVAIVRSTSRPGAPPLKVQTKVFPFQLSLSDR